LCVYARFQSRVLPWFILFGAIVLAQCLPTVIGTAVIPAFVMGYLIPDCAWIWRRQAATRRAAFLVFAGGSALFLLARSTHWAWPTTTLLEAVGASTIIGCIVYGADIAPFHLLDHEWTRRAGRLSYSYYLLHPLALVPVSAFLLPVLQRELHHQYALGGAVLLWIVSSAIAFPLAWLSYTWIEGPMIALGRAIRFPLTLSRAKPTFV
jgi:peptidoglycan/LPS O-acetylase OafA/YrhL